MKKCSSCQYELPLSDFSFQKTNRNKRYAWCDGCRKAAVPRCNPASFRNEMNELRNKAKQLRRFTDADTVLIQQARASGTSAKALASEHNCSINTIYKELKRPVALPVAV